MRILLHFYKNRLKWINKYRNQFQMIYGDKFFLILELGFLVLFIFIGMIGYKNMKMTDLASLQNKRSAFIVNELNDIHSILHDIESNPFNSRQQQMTLQSLEQDIVVAQKSMLNLAKTSDIQKVSSQISSVKDDIDSQMGEMKKAIAEGVGSKQFLDASALPFHVISVDIIAGESYVSVEYDNHIFPLAIGDLLTGWRVISADYEADCAEFANEKSQYVKVDLQGA